MARTTEGQVQYYILKVMQTRSIFSNARLKELLGQELALSKGDTARSMTRPNEAKWENIVNNALSPSRSNSLYRQGAVESCGHGLHRITEKGIAILHEQERWHQASKDAFGDTLREWK